VSKLSLFCEKLLEACWLAAIILAPLFFDVYSSRVFEPDKIALVRSLALVMLAAWVTIRVEMVRSGNASLARSRRLIPILAQIRSTIGEWSVQNPLTLPAALFVAIYLVSTVTSLSPSVSFLGSYQRMQGLYTTLSYIAIFFLAASTIRSKTQIDRAISAALVVSFPIALYGIIQHYFLDPLPWGGDVTARVASNMGNSIFVAAYLIMVLPLTLGRLVETARRATEEIVSSPNPALAKGGSRSAERGGSEQGREEPSTTGKNPWAVRGLVYGGIILSFVVLVAVWWLSFEFGAKGLIEAGYSGTLTPAMLEASASNFNLALGITILVVFGWWALAFVAKRRARSLLLLGIYTLLLAVQSITILFTQSRGPLLGLMGALFTFAVVYALVRGARRVALGAMTAAVAMLAFLVMFNLAQAAPFVALRDLPYIGRLGRVFETEGGTGEVRVLIWEGALKLVLPHSPLEFPTGGFDVLNPIRPLIGYGPETMYVAYNRFYPPDLAHLESRNATPDRSHDETFDALVTTGLIGFISENLIYLCIFYFALKWLGFVNSARERNAFIALWYLGGLLVAMVFGLVMGWQFIGVALPAGMITGFFIYLVGFALLRPKEVHLNQDPVRALLLVSLLSVIVAHFVEIHFGIAIVATRTYFWFVAALLVVVGTQHVAELSTAPEPVQNVLPEETSKVEVVNPAARKKLRRAERQRVAEARRGRHGDRSSDQHKGQERRTTAAPPRQPTLRTKAVEVTTAPLIAFAFLTGLILSTMGFDYITANSVSPNASPLDVVASALLSKVTTSGPQPSNAMLWLFAGTLLIAMVIAIAEWGRDARLSDGEWMFAVGLFLVLSLAVSSTFIFFNVFLITTPGAGAFDATLSAFSLFVVFILVTVSVVGITLLFDYHLPSRMVARATTFIVAPVMGCFALAFILIPNVSISAVSVVQADIVYKDALALANGTTLAQSIQRFHQALEMQPSQDYYWLFLGRSYLEYAKTIQDSTQREKVLTEAENALLRARNINPLQTDHTANLARLHEAWAPLVADPAARVDHYKKSLDYYAVVVRMSPNTVHLYDQYAQAELEYAAFLKTQNQTTAATEATRAAQDEVGRALTIDPVFCLSYAVRAQTQNGWDAEARDALEALKYAPSCGDVFVQEGRATAMQTLFDAGDRATSAGAGDRYVSLLEDEARTDPTVELYTALTNYYSTAGQIDRAVKAADGAIALIPTSDPTTLKKYQDFRAGLASLQQSISAAKTAPNDPEAHRTLAKAWLARGQAEFALPEYEKVLNLLPNDYDANRMVALLLVQDAQLADARSAITTTLTLAPANERPFWQQLGVVLEAAQKGQNDSALATLDALIKSVDPKDNVTLQALRQLSTKLKGSG
jgi:tetratricopeptide (TPR) repeat protein